jgi:hypothetical protein
MPTTVLSAVTRLRQRLDDFGGDTGPDHWLTDDSGCLWKNAELTAYLQESQLEFCRRNPLMDSTSVYASIKVRSGVATYELDPLILAVERAYLVTAGRVLIKRHHRDDIDTQTYVAPLDTEYYYEDQQAHSLTLFAAPSAADTLSLVIRRLPLEPLSWAYSRDELEVNDLFVEDLLLYASYLAWSKRDADAMNLEAANTAMERFRSRVGEPVNVKLLDVRKQVANKPLLTRAYY